MNKMIVNIRKKILIWLFGTDNVDKYMTALTNYIDEVKQHRDTLDNYLKTMDGNLEDLRTIRKLIKICENHEIDVDEEIKHIQLLDGEN